MPYTIERATTQDAPAIARIFLSNESDGFLKLQFGTADEAQLEMSTAESLTESIEREDQIFIVARDDESDEVIGYAQWSLPRDEFETVMERTSEEKAFDQETFQKKLLPGMNKSLVMDFREKLRDTRENLLSGRRYYLLGNIGTLPSHQRRGVASELTRWSFHKADSEGIIVYLETDQEGLARNLYERLGFKRAAETVFDLSKYDSEGLYTHIAMVRAPRECSS